jgi:flotillin
LAIEGENTSLGEISQSDASRREIEAESLRRATAAEKIASAKALEESYLAEKKAEFARASREKASLEADVIVKSEIDKQKKVIEAEAVAEQIRREAKGQADGTYSKMEAEARGTLEILSKQADGFNALVQAAGNNPESAIQYLIAEKLETLVQIQVEAIKNLKFDNVTVWDTGNNADGKTQTANFASGLMKSIPPMSDLFKMTGMELPSYLGKQIKEEVKEVKPEVEKEEKPVEEKPKKTEDKSKKAFKI